MQALSLSAYITVIAYAYRLEYRIDSRPIYEDPLSAAARILLPATKAIKGESVGSIPGSLVSETPNVNDLLLCGTATEGVIPSALPRWMLESDNSGLTTLVNTQVSASNNCVRSVCMQLQKAHHAGNE